MFCKIELLPKQSINEKEAEELIWSFLCSLERNGQILKDYKLIKNENFEMYVSFPKSDSFDEKHDGLYVRRERKKISEAFKLVINTIGKNVESQSYCECKNRTAIEMQTYDRDIDSVFTCCNCGKPIVYYELPYPAENQEDYCWVQNWQENYSSMDMLWMNCLCDRYTGNQRVKLDSVLNKQGIEIAEYMGKQLSYPVYYHVECDYGKSVKVEKVDNQQIHICPKCQNLMKRVKFSEDYERDICEECNLSYNAH